MDKKTIQYIQKKYPDAADEIREYILEKIPYEYTNPETQEALREGFTIDNLGFIPSLIFSAAGVTFENRQTLVFEISKLLNLKPPVKFIAEPDNEFDPSAIGIHVGISKDQMTGKWTYAQIGYVPRRFCSTCKSSFGGKYADSETCPFCNKKFDPIVYFNEYIKAKLSEDNVTHSGVAFAGTDESKTNANYGLKVGVKIE